MGAMAHVLAANPVPARSQMGSSLGFHIILACFGIAFAAVIMIAEWIGIKRGDAAALLLARRWSKVMAVLVAVGAVSGTVLSYEMGLLWPGLMGRFGAAIGFPFSVEGIFFFLEAIFVGVYLYGWKRLSPWAHWWSGMPIVVSGILGAMSVVAANSWMNSPAGYTLSHGKITRVEPLSVYFNASTPYETTHMILAAYMVAGFLIAGVYAVGLLRGRRDRYHRLGLAIPFTVAGIAAPLQVLMGDVIARFIASKVCRHAGDPVRCPGRRPWPHTAAEPVPFLEVLSGSPIGVAGTSPGTRGGSVVWWVLARALSPPSATTARAVTSS